MGRLTVLQALQTILETQFDRVYIYPDEYSTINNDPALPFFVLEELPATENNTVSVGSFADLVGIEWTVSLYGYAAVGEFPSPGHDDATAKALTYGYRDTIRTLLQANLWPSGVISTLGDDRRLYTDFIVRLQWNEQPYLGLYFEIPVTSG